VTASVQPIRDDQVADDGVTAFWEQKRPSAGRASPRATEYQPTNPAIFSMAARITTQS